MSRGAPLGVPYGGERLTVVPELGGQRFMPFPRDVGLGVADTGAPDMLRGGIGLSFAGLAPLDVVLLRLAAFDDVDAVWRAVVRANGDDGSIGRALEEPVCLQSGGEADGSVECW